MGIQENDHAERKEVATLSSYNTDHHPDSSVEWEALNFRPRVEAGFVPQTGSSLEIPGISLVHLANTCFALAGDRLQFTAWILNATSETLQDVEVVERSFTNAGLEDLQFETRPDERILKGRALGPRQSLQYSFTYVVKPGDLRASGELISALAVKLSSETHGTLYSECDAIVSTNADDTAPRHFLHKYSALNEVFSTTKE